MNLNDSSSTFRALGLTSGIGAIMAACTLGGYFIGRYLDTKFGTAPWLLISTLLLCMIAGFIEIYNMLKKATKETSKDEKEN